MLPSMPSPSERGGLQSIPIEHASPTDLTEVRDLEAHAVRIGEESRVAVGGVLGIKARVGHRYAGLPKLRGRAIDCSLIEHSEAEVMEARRVRVVIRRGGSRRPQREAELSVVVVDVRISADRRLDLAVSEDDHHAVVESLGASEVAHRDVDVVDADDLD